ncbi:hypothetical protein B7P43_G00565, partial [Cryptotermes secundus]
ASKAEDSAQLFPSLQSLGNPGTTSYAKQPASHKNLAVEEDSYRSHPDATVAITGLTFQQQQHRDEFSRQDPSVSAHSEEELQQDNGTGISSVARTRRETKNASEMTQPKPEADYDESDTYLESEDKSSSNPEEYKEAVPTHNRKEEDAVSMGQHFFSSFAPVFPAPSALGRSRPSIFQEPAYSQRPALLRPQQNTFQPINFGGGSFRDNQHLHTEAAAETSTSDLLGSGNFGVIRGGTFYGDDDQKETNVYGARGNHQFFSPYYHSNNGHGRPAFYGGGGSPNPRPQNHRGNDFFANFRDFADINTPTKSSFSEYVVVYVNKNNSKHDDGSDQQGSKPGDSKPKNIIERLTMLDNEDQEKLTAPEEEEPVTPPSNTQQVKAEKKGSSTLSPAKLKLALFQDKFNKEKIKKVKTTSSASDPKDLYEPLLALS